MLRCRAERSMADRREPSYTYRRHKPQRHRSEHKDTKLLLSCSRLHLIVGLLQHTQFSSSQFFIRFIFCHIDRSHVLVYTFHSSLLRYSSHSSPRWCHLQWLYSDVVLVWSLFTCPNHLSLAFLHLYVSVNDVLYL